MRPTGPEGDETVAVQRNVLACVTGSILKAWQFQYQEVCLFNHDWILMALTFLPELIENLHILEINFMIKTNIKTTAGIILAAGMSTRMQQLKQLVSFNGKPMLSWVMEAALASQLKTVFIILGHESQKIIKTLALQVKRPKLQVVINPNFRQGHSSSLICGLTQALDTHHDAVMFLLADQPCINSSFINYLLDQFYKENKPICAPRYLGRQLNPVIFQNTFYDKLLSIKGDKGAKQLIKAHSDRVTWVDVDQSLVFMTVDTPEDLDAVRLCYRRTATTFPAGKEYHPTNRS